MVTGHFAISEHESLGLIDETIKIFLQAPLGAVVHDTSKGYVLHKDSNQKSNISKSTTVENN